MIYDYIVIESGFGGSVASLTITAITEYAMNSIPHKNGCGITDISKQLKLLEEEWKRKRYK